MRVTGFPRSAVYMHLLGPKTTQELLRRRQNFTMAVPKPAVLGRMTNYPTECVVHFNKDADVCHIVFKGFEPIQ